MHSESPVDSSVRIHGLDAVRGVALLGILIANVRQFFFPPDISDFPLSQGIPDIIALIDWGMFHSLVDLKFLTLFSLLFGIGFALQKERLTERGTGFAGIYVRRVLILAAFGILHGLLFFPAEVLFLYAMTGIVLLGLHRLSVENLFRIGLILLGATLIWGYQIGSLGKVYPLVTALSVVLLACVTLFIWKRSMFITLLGCVTIAAIAAVFMTFDSDLNPETGLGSEFSEVQEKLDAIATGNSVSWPPDVKIHREGGTGSLIMHHFSVYQDLLFYMAIFLFWRTLGVFMIGAGIYRKGWLKTLSEAEWRRVAIFGIAIGLPLSICATVFQGLELLGEIDWRFPKLLHSVSALPLAAGYGGLVFMLTSRKSLRLLWAPLESTGRMALTNYLAQSVVMTGLAEFWGFGLYGRFTGPELTTIALVVFGSLAFCSHLWLKRFQMGPIEWFWRCGTYWQWLPNMKNVPKTRMT